MIIEFHDKKGHSDHDAFVEWRISHIDENSGNDRDGYFLAVRKNSRAELHTWECRQRSAGGLNWDGFFGTPPNPLPSSTRQRKVCSDDRTELLAWASSNGTEIVYCMQCLKEPPGTLGDKVIVSAEHSRGEGEWKRINQAIEGIARETTITIRSRSEPLRRAVLERAKGICEACGTDYSSLAGGLGKRVLQVHHRRQLALAGEPVTNCLDDLAVVCANCHLMIHADVSNAMSVEELRQRLAGRDAS